MVDIPKVAKNTRVFGSRFVNQSKPSNDEARYKSRLVVQNYCDDQAATIATIAPTFQRFMLSMVALLEH